MQPTLETPRLRLRLATAADADALWALWTAPAVRRFPRDDRVITPFEAAAALDDGLALASAGLRA